MGEVIHSDDLYGFIFEQGQYVTGSASQVASYTAFFHILSDNRTDVETAQDVFFYQGPVRSKAVEEPAGLFCGFFSKLFEFGQVGNQ